MRNAKIVCTLGPASSSSEMISALVEAGMSVARINASHGEPKQLKEYFAAVRTVEDALDTPVATMLDLAGPEIRTAPMDRTITLEEGQSIRFVPEAETGDGVIGISRSIAAAAIGDRILLDDGRLSCTVTETNGASTIASVDRGGELDGRKGVNVPGVDLDFDIVTDRDRAQLQLLETGLIDFVAASFVTDGADIVSLQSEMESIGHEVPIIAKIERAEAVSNLSDIIDESYGIMVARGDLGVECPMEDIPLIQKRIIRRCQEHGVPVITATEMLDSMIESPRPTRAEASDVANAVLDGTDAVMLSAETAVGTDPVLVVETMDTIVREIESSSEYDELREQRVPTYTSSRTDALSRSARNLARDLDAEAIVATSESGYTALRIAKYRPSVPVVGVTLSEAVYRRMALSWGLRPHLSRVESNRAPAVIDDAVKATLADDIATGGDTLVLLTGMMHEIEGAELTNTVKLHVAAETLAVGPVVVPGRATGAICRVDDGDLSNLPEEAIIVLDRSFDAELTGPFDRIRGIISAESGLTGYPALLAREIDVPMISDASMPDDISDGTIVTLDAERGVVYDGDISAPSLLDERRNGIQ